MSDITKDVELFNDPKHFRKKFSKGKVIFLWQPSVETQYNCFFPESRNKLFFLRATLPEVSNANDDHRS